MIVADLATNWKASSNGLVYTFDLRKGVKFHDGTAFNCSAIGSDFARRLAVNQGPAYMVQDVKSVTCPSPYQAVITLKKAENDFLAGLASEYGPKMISPTALKEHAGNNHDEAWLAAHDAGTGPYTVVKSSPTSGYVLRYYPDYWGPKPYYTTIDLPIVSDVSTQELELETGKAAVLLGGLPTRTVTSLRSNKKLAVYTLPTERGVVLNVNPYAPGLASRSVRKAVLDAIDPKTIDKVVYPDGAAQMYDGVYPPHQFGAKFAPQKITYDPRLLTRAASELRGKKVVIAYGASDPNLGAVANLIQSELASSGVHAQVISLTSAQFFASVGKVTTLPSVDISDTWPDASNPYTWAHIAYDPTGGLSYFQCPDPTATAALDRAVSIPTLTAARSAYASAGEDYASMYCWDWVNSRDDVMVAQAKLGGVAQAHSVMAPMTLFFRHLHPIGT